MLPAIIKPIINMLIENKMNMKKIGTLLVFVLLALGSYAQQEQQ